VCKSANALQKITKLAGDWVRESVSDLVEGDPDVITGEVRVLSEAEE
jgi:hypothetical protein